MTWLYWYNDIFIALYREGLPWTAETLLHLYRSLMCCLYFQCVTMLDGLKMGDNIQNVIENSANLSLFGECRQWGMGLGVGSGLILLSAVDRPSCVCVCVYVYGSNHLLYITIIILSPCVNISRHPLRFTFKAGKFDI